MSQDYSQTVQGVLQVKIDPLGNSDVIQVDGNVFLRGTLAIIPSSGTYITGTMYTFLTSSIGNISGSFDTITVSNGPNLLVSYGAQSIQIIVE
jgi:hypothetical protein